jgi:8-oxo-dGTP pyrophosphatase MutT (NUDIX family)
VAGEPPRRPAQNHHDARSPAAPRRDPPADAPHVAASREVYRNPWTRVREDQLVRPDGSAGLYGVVEKPDFVVVLPYEDGGYWLVEQYRHPVGGRYWEFPQGSVATRPLPPPAEVAAIELREETGLVAGRLEVLGYLFAAYGTSSQGYHVVLATDLVRGPAALEPEEADLVSAWFPIADVEAMIADGRMRDAHSLAALALLDRHRRTAPPQRR